MLAAFAAVRLPGIISVMNNLQRMSIHCDILRQLNGESGEDWILPLFHAIFDHWAKRVLPLPGWER